MTGREKLRDVTRKRRQEKKDEETYASLTSEHQFRLEMKLPRQILSVNTKNTTRTHPHFRFFSAFIEPSAVSTKRLSQSNTNKEVCLTHP